MLPKPRRGTVCRLGGGPSAYHGLGRSLGSPRVATGRTKRGEESPRRSRFARFRRRRRLALRPSPLHSPRLAHSPAAAAPPRAGPMRAIARAASLLRRAAAYAAPRSPLGAGGPLLPKNLPNVCFNGYSTLLAPSNEVLIPPELLSSKTVWTPDRELGQYEDLVARVTNFHNEDKGFMVLDGDVFDVPIRKDIVHRVVRWQLAKRQQGTHSTKTISEVSGTGRKPYKQKGTGRARHGTLRGPQFRGGATMHGPKPRSHAIKLQKKVRRLGLKIALSARTAEGKLLIFEDLEVPSHKTKNIVQHISQMEDTKKVLLVDVGDIDKKLKLATQNLHYVNVLPSIGLNVYSILQHDTLVLTRDAINRIVERMHTPINR